MLNQVREGMIVRSADGEKLGKVVACDNQGFIIEKGFFFPQEFRLPYAAVDAYDEDGVRVSVSKQDLSGSDTSWLDRLLGGKEPVNLYGLRHEDQTTASAQSTLGTSTSETVRVPLREEQLRVEKTDEQYGAVKVRKDIVEEEQTIRVPVRREEAHVERGPATEASAADKDAVPFQEQTVSVPLREERVIVTKEPVIREEVRVTKTTETSDQPVSDTVRKERADVQKTDAAKKTGKSRGEFRP
jgi:uncharacterized protein (TIGR02271 family)